jgi:hypothetical protein
MDIVNEHFYFYSLSRPMVIKKEGSKWEIISCLEKKRDLWTSTYSYSVPRMKTLANKDALSKLRCSGNEEARDWPPGRIHSLYIWTSSLCKEYRCVQRLWSKESTSTGRKGDLINLTALHRLLVNTQLWLLWWPARPHSTFVVTQCFMHQGPS